MNDSSYEDRIARLEGVLRELGGELPQEDAEELAARFELEIDVVLDCNRAIVTLTRAIEPVDGAGDLGVLSAVLPESYEVLGELGRGGMGIVYRARHRSLGREVAIKVLRSGEQLMSDMFQRFEREAKSLAKLRHPHIVTVHDVGRAGGHVFYTMDLIEGRSLDVVLKDGALSPSEAVRIVTQVTSAIEHSHEHGVIHRDLKPANILLDESDNVYVADFGLARDINLDVELTTTGQLMGTPAYMSPEAMRGDGSRIGERTDIWAIGAMLYEALTGVSPFRRKNLVDTMQAVLNEEAVPLRKRNPRVPRDLELVCHKAMAKSPEDRYATARAMREDLERFRQGLPVLAERPSVTKRATRWFVRNRQAVLGSAVAATLVAFFMVFVRPDAPSPRIIDSMIRSAQAREGQEAWEEAFELYQHARGVLGSDAERPHRASEHVVTDSLLDQVWRGLLECRSRLSWKDVASGRRSQAAREMATWFLQCPPGVDWRWRARYSGELAALWTFADQPSNAIELLGNAYRGSELDGASRSWTTCWSACEPRLRTLWESPEDPSYRSSGRVLAAVISIAMGGDSSDAELRGFDVTTAFIAAWWSSDSLDPNVRSRIRSRLRDAAFGSDTPIGWGGPRPEVLRALTTLASDRSLSTSTRIEALDLLCALSDLPWRPDLSGTLTRIDDGTALDARTLCVAIRDLDRDEASRMRVDFAVSLLAGADDSNAMSLRNWLAGRTGMEPTTDFAAWWPRHRGESFESRLRSALDLDAENGADSGERIAAQFARLDGLDRRRYHQWRIEVADSGQAVPVWPSLEPEPANLVATWQSGVRRIDDRYVLDYSFEQWDPDGRHLVGSWKTTSALPMDEPERTYFASDLVSLAELSSPVLSYERRTPQLGVTLPGFHDFVGDPPNPSLRVDLEGRLVLRDELRFVWSARVTSGSDYTGTLPEMLPQKLDSPCVRVVDGWYGGYEGERSGPLVLAVGARLADGRDGFVSIQNVLDGALASIMESSDESLFELLACVEARAFEWNALETIARIGARVPSRDRVRGLDERFARLRTDDAAIARAIEAASLGSEGARIVRGRLASMLAARVVAGDETACDSFDFERRLEEAEAGLGLDAWWWLRVAESESTRLREIAHARLEVLPLTNALLMHLSKHEELTSFPTSVQAQVERMNATRAAGVSRVTMVFIALIGILLVAGTFVTRNLLRRSNSERAPSTLVHASVGVMALASLALVVVEARFGRWRLPPVSVGLIGLVWTAALHVGIARTRVQITALILTLFALLAGILADTRSHDYASAVASILTAASLSLMSLSIVPRGGRRSAWTVVPSVLFGVAFSLSAFEGVRVLVTERLPSSFSALMQASSSGAIVRECSMLGLVAFTVIVVASIVSSALNRHAR
ncbi:MAG: protein kinase [Planctomycetes bacterium]|nr:protein kinase [Planctomycetota bacterium]MCB9919502.1 protein kinase [Planctomycetota bacterium]